MVRFQCWLTMVALALSARPGCRAQGASAEAVLMVSVDGLRPVEVLEAGQRGARPP